MNNRTAFAKAQNGISQLISSLHQITTEIKAPSRSSTICVVVERPDHRCGDDLVLYCWHDQVAHASRCMGVHFKHFFKHRIASIIDDSHSGMSDVAFHTASSIGRLSCCYVQFCKRLLLFSLLCQKRAEHDGKGRCIASHSRSRCW